MRLRARIADAAHQLHHALGPRPRERSHRVDGGEQGRAPRGHPDEVAAREREFEVGACRDAEVVDHAVVAGVHRFHDDGFAESVRLLERVLQRGLHAGRHNDRGANDAFRLGLLEQPRHPRLGDVEPASDLRLADVVLVVKASHLCHQPQLVVRASAGAIAAVGRPAGHGAILGLYEASAMSGLGEDRQHHRSGRVPEGSLLNKDALLDRDPRPLYTGAPPAAPPLAWHLERAGVVTRLGAPFRGRGARIGFSRRRRLRHQRRRSWGAAMSWRGWRERSMQRPRAPAQPCWSTGRRASARQACWRPRAGTARRRECGCSPGAARRSSTSSRWASSGSASPRLCAMSLAR